MSIRSNTEVVNEFRQFYRDCSDTTAGEYFIQAVKELARDFDLYTDSAACVLTADSASYPFVDSAGTPWYTVNSSGTKATTGIWQIKDVFYIASSSSQVRLSETSEIDLTDIDSQWRYIDSGTPSLYYRTSNSSGVTGVGLYPAPDTSSSVSDGTGYPRIEVHYRSVPATPTSIPLTIQNYKVVLYGMLVQWARQIGDPALGTYEAEYKRLRGELGRYLAGFLAQKPPTLTWRRSRRRFV